MIARLTAAAIALWHEMSPMVSYGDSFLERWDGKGEGPARSFGFEGFGISFSLFFGRMPKATHDIEAAQ